MERVRRALLSGRDGVVSAGARRLLPAVLLAAGCSSWEESRRTYVDDVNSLIHVRLPRLLRGHDLEQVLTLYSPELAADGDFVASKRAYLEEFAEIARAHCIILELEPQRAARPAGARASLQVHGRAPDGSKRFRRDELELEYARVDGEWRITSERLIETQAAGEPGVQFVEEAAARGLVNLASIGQVLDRHGVLQNYPAGSGLAVGDIDGDDYDDLYLVNGHECRLFRNLGGERFEDITERTGTAARVEGKSRLALIADYDGDGRKDIFVGVLNGPNLLYRQEEDGTFSERAAAAGLTPTLETMAACFADFDNDGLLDLYVVNGRNPYMEDPDPPYNALNGFPNHLFLNNGDGTFRDESQRAGVAHTGYGLSTAAADYDGDGDTDLFVGNDFGYDVLYRNRGDAVFTDVTAAAGLGERRSSMSSCWGDVDGDGLPELFIGAMYSNSQWMVDQPGYPVPAPWPVSMLFPGRVLGLVREMLNGNLLYKNNGDGTFTAAHPEVINTGWSWSALFLDADNDSLLDVYLVNGFVSGDDRQDL
jgi:hypothetical protein